MYLVAHAMLAGGLLLAGPNAPGVELVDGQSTTTSTLGRRVLPPKDPYSTLFSVPPVVDQTSATASAPVLRDPVGSPVRPPRDPRVACGMPIIPLDPSIDPKIVIPVPRDQEYTIRVIPPPMCR